MPTNDDGDTVDDDDGFEDATSVDWSHNDEGTIIMFPDSDDSDLEPNYPDDDDTSDGDTTVEPDEAIVEMDKSAPAEPESHFNFDWSYFSQIFQPLTPVWMQHLMLVTFWFTMLAWESVTYLFRDIGADASYRVPRRERRRKVKQEWGRRHDRGRRLPDLVFVPILWMVMTNAIMIPTNGKHLSPIMSIQEFTSQLFQFGRHAYH